MAAAAIARDFLVQFIFWCGVTGLALITGLFFKQAMVEVALHAITLDARMIAMTSDAILTHQFLMKRARRELTGDRHALRAHATDVGGFVATGASRRTGTGEGRMAGKTITLQLFVARN